jgi:very-short-patch-repair endonuclease
MKKTLSIRPESERTDALAPVKKARGWDVSDSRLDTLHETARELRRNPTEAQVALGEALVKAELGKFRFRKQVVIGSAVVDFACQALKVVVEVDEPEGNPEIERRNDKTLEAIGMKVLRYPAAEVLADADAVAARIFAEMKKTYEAQRAARPRSGARPNSNAGRPGARREYQK